MFVRRMFYSKTKCLLKRYSTLKKVLAAKIEEERDKVKELKKSCGSEIIQNILVGHLYEGMRGLTLLVSETSLLDPDQGIKFRGLSIPECQKQLPKRHNGFEILPEGMLWLLLTGKIPTTSQAIEITEELAYRGEVKPYVIGFINRLPNDVHPMSQLAAAVTLMNSNSKFKQALQKGVNKSSYWEHYYEDSMDLLSALPIIAATIYQKTFKNETALPKLCKDLDWAGNVACLMGFKDPQFSEMLRLYLSIHADHEGGNISAHTCLLVGSALSDPYLSYAAGMNGLAGPLHGLACQNVLEFIQTLVEEVGQSPTDDEIVRYVTKTLQSGRVIPGYGHAVLRTTDPRFLCQMEFAKKHLPDDPLVKIVHQMFRLVPPLLRGLGKVKNPWPNVDAHSGVLLNHYGLKETSFYTVMFGVARALGVLSSLIWHRALYLPIERPKSITTEKIMDLYCKKKRLK